MLFHKEKRVYTAGGIVLTQNCSILYIRTYIVYSVHKSQELLVQDRRNRIEMFAVYVPVWRAEPKFLYAKLIVYICKGCFIYVQTLLVFY